ncbi:hypothetical protein [Streptomyces sp. MA5143a]|uniref:hypothetical protein n=1 Tax=Streptomyces sp. MA5143a TaxID=2083010 RepID=UPI0011B1D06E|nr:hypothetical protein [Streptomyces sp. MA5143a]
MGPKARSRRRTAAARSAPLPTASLPTASLSTAPSSPASLAPPLALALSPALLTACTAVDGGEPDGGGKKPAPSDRPTATTATPAPAYDGPRLPGFAAKPAWSLATGRTAPGVLDLTFTGTTVWRLPDGKRLWTQEEGADETPLDPVRFTRDGSVLYGYATAADGTEHGLAVDPRTREVLAEDLPVDHVPAVDEATGYGHLSTTDGFHAFAPAG